MKSALPWRQAVVVTTSLLLVVLSAFVTTTNAQSKGTKSIEVPDAADDGWEQSSPQVALQSPPTPVAAIGCGFQPGGLCGGQCPPNQGCAVIGTGANAECKCAAQSCKDTDPGTAGLQCGGVCAPNSICLKKTIPTAQGPRDACSCVSGGNNCELSVRDSGEAICTGQCASGGCKVNSAGDGCECGNTCETTVDGQGQIQCGGACETGSVCTLEGEQCGCKPISPPTPTPTPPTCSGQVTCSGTATQYPGNTCENHNPLDAPTLSVCDDAGRNCQSNWTACPAGCMVDESTVSCTNCKSDKGLLDTSGNCTTTCTASCKPVGSGGGGSSGGTGSGSGGGGTGGGGTGGPVVTSCAGKKQVGPETGAVSSDDNQCSQAECDNALNYCKQRLNEKCRGSDGLNPGSVQLTEACSYTGAGEWLDGKCKVSCKGCCNLQ